MFLADDDDKGLAGAFPAACVETFPALFFGTFFNGFFFATGFATRLDGDFFDVRPDLPDTGFFFAVFFAVFFAGFFAVFAFDGLPERRFGARDLAVGRLRAGFERGFVLRLAFALVLARDFFIGFEAFLAMVVLLVGARLLRRAHVCTGISRDWGESGKLQIITCA
jgi:hypothetical protein